MNQCGHVMSESSMHTALHVFFAEFLHVFTKVGVQRSLLILSVLGTCDKMQVLFGGPHRTDFLDSSTR